MAYVDACSTIARCKEQLCELPREVERSLAYYERHIELLGEAVVQHSAATATLQQAGFVAILQFEKSRYELLRTTMLDTRPRILELVAAANSGGPLAQATEDIQDRTRGEDGGHEESDGEDEEGLVFEEAECAPAYVDSGFSSDGDRDGFFSCEEDEEADSQEED